MTGAGSVAEAGDGDVAAEARRAGSPTLSLGDGVDLPLDAVTETFVIVGRRGSGKTSTAAVLVEEMLAASQRVVVIDPTGVWWGLRSSADGIAPGFPVVIFGGDHADVPIEAKSGGLVADLIASEHLAAVIDLSNLSKSKQRMFNTAFLERLYHRNREPLHVVIDEADTVAPQRPGKGTERLLGAADDLVRRGRVRGIGVTLITQRPAVLAKDVMTQASTLIVMQLTGPQDRTAVDDWVKQNADEEVRRQLLDSLASLPTGTGWLWSPGWLDTLMKVTIRRRRTFDSSQTPTVGGTPTAPKQHANVDVAYIRSQLPAVELAEASHPSLRARELGEAHRQLDQARAAWPTPVETPDPEFDRQTAKLLLNRLDDLSSRAERLGREIAATRADVATAYDAAQLANDDGHDDGTGRSARNGVRPSRLSPPRPAPGPSVPQFDGDDALRLQAGPRRMLAALAQSPGSVLTRRQIATLAKVEHTGGAFGTYWSTLRSNGLVAEVDGGWVITDAGVAALGDQLPQLLSSSLEAVTVWSQHLTAGVRTMLLTLVDHHPSGVSREELADAMGLAAEGGTFDTYLSTLRRNGLAHVDGQHVRVGGALFRTSDL